MVSNVVTSTTPIVVIEGNWVLFDEFDWCCLQDMRILPFF